MKVKMIDLISSFFVGKSIMVYLYRYKNLSETILLALDNDLPSLKTLIKSEVWLIDKVTIDSDWSGDTIVLHSGSNTIETDLGNNGDKEITFV